MNQNDDGIFGERAVSLMQGVCPTDGQALCSLRKAVPNFPTGRNRSKDFLSRCEVEAFLFLEPGHRVFVLVHETGEVWRGVVDLPFPERGLMWVVTDLGERKLLDIGLHTFWQLDSPQGRAAMLSPRVRSTGDVPTN